MLDSAIFWVFAVLAVTAALGAVAVRSIIYAALCLIAVFLSIAGFFVLNNADFLAIAQVIIYAVGLTIIMLFAIMFTGDKPFAEPHTHRTAHTVSKIILAYVVLLLIPVAARLSIPGGQTLQQSGLLDQITRNGSTGLLGLSLFKTFALPFELASILLLAAMIGAIVIAKKRFVEADELRGSTQFEVDADSRAPDDVIAALRAQRLEGGTAAPAVKAPVPAEQTKGAE